MEPMTMSELLETPCIRWYKTPCGKVVNAFTNCRRGMEQMKRETNIVRADGLILRKTRKEAENDPTP